MRQIEQDVVPPPPQRWAPVVAGLAFLTAVLLALAYWNVADLAVLHDQQLPTLVFWPAFWVLLAVGVTMLIPSVLRSAWAVASAFGGTGFVVFLAVCVLLAVSVFGGGSSSRRGELVDSRSSADGRYRVEVFGWQSFLGEPGWDVVVYRRGGLRYTEAYAGCLFSEALATYNRIESVEAGSVRLDTDQGLISITFDPDTMQVTKRIPGELCAGYE